MKKSKSTRARWTAAQAGEVLDRIERSGLSVNRYARLDFRVDISRLFRGSATVDMAALPAVRFDRTDAQLLARNFAGMITPMRADAP